MRTIRIILPALVCSVLIVSCGDNTAEKVITEQKQDTMTIIRKEDTISEASIASINNSIKQFSFTSLLEFLPQDIEGYTLSEEPINGEDGGIGKTGTRYFSFASKTFVKNEEKIK